MAKPKETLSYPAGNGSQLQISVWENEVQKDGQKFTTYAVSVQRRYRDGDEWKSSSTLHPGDLLITAHGLQRAYERIRELNRR